MTPQCGFCGRGTNDPIYVGKIRGCGARVAFGRCCKELILKQFKTIRAAASAYGRLHTISCQAQKEREHDDVMIDLSNEGEFVKNPLAN